jgi:G3E family GTPase
MQTFDSTAPTTTVPTTTALGSPLSVPIPVVLIGGFLGAGKTTLVNHLIRQASGRKIWVLVNDFGELPIDADLIESRDDQVIRLAGGCVCCSYGSDLISTLKQISEGDTVPDVLLLETSGVSLPGPILMSLSLLPNLKVGCTIVMADASAITAQLCDRYVADTVANQLQAAGIIGLNKIDLISRDHAQTLGAMLSGRCPGATVVLLEEGRMAAELVFGFQSPNGSTSNPAPRWARQPQHASQFDSLALELEGCYDLSRLSHFLNDYQQALLRAKVIAPSATGEWNALHYSGSGWRLSPLSKKPARAGAVFIFKAPLQDSTVTRGALLARLGQAACALSVTPSVTPSV